MFCKTKEKPKFKINDKVYTAVRYAQVSEGVVKAVKTREGIIQYVVENKYEEKKSGCKPSCSHASNYSVVCPTIGTGKMITGLVYINEDELFERV